MRNILVSGPQSGIGKYICEQLNGIPLTREKNQIVKKMNLILLYQVKKLKNIRDNKTNSNKIRSSKKLNNEIKKLNETINLAEDLFTKELLDL